MSERDYRLFIQDIIDSIIKIEDYTSGLTFDAFQSNEMVKDAVLRNFEIIGEASSHIPDDIKSKNISVPWRELKSVRNLVIHEYFGVDLEIIWKTISKSLPELKTEIMKALNSEGNS
jgi:uncharacterized protein with HEPN domain